MTMKFGLSAASTDPNGTMKEKQENRLAQRCRVARMLGGYIVMVD